MQDRLAAALRNAHAAGDTAAAQKLARALRASMAEQPPEAAPEPPTGPMLAPETMAAAFGGAPAAAPSIAGLSMDPAQLAADILPPAMEYRDRADGMIEVLPGSRAAGVAAMERAQREQAYQEGQAARAEYDAALNPASWVDTVQHQAGGLFSNTGSAVEGIGKFIQDTYNIPVGAPLTSTLSALFGEGAPDVTLEGNPLQASADSYRNFGESLQEGTGAGYRQMMARNEWGGSLADPSSWTLGSDPSLRGQLERGGEVIGSLLPVLAASYATGGSATAGGLVGGGMAGSGAQDQVEDELRRMAADGSLYERSGRYRELLDGRTAPEAALEQVIAEARDAAFYPAAAVGGAGGAAT
ncbi:MAG: hypothetical protein WCY29_18150, partial [Novosphingobium sp.]